jgi:hypothetical protein
MFTVRFASPKFLEESSDRNHTNIVLALTESGSFFSEAADDCEGMPVEFERFSNRRFMGEQMFSQSSCL